MTDRTITLTPTICVAVAKPPHPPYVCTLPIHHEGDHEAHTPNGELKLQWENP